MSINGRPVIYFVESNQNGCNFYRIKQPAFIMLEKDIFPCASSSILKGGEHELYLEKADIIVSQGVMSDKFLEYMVEEKGRKKFILDYDDNIFAVSPYNPSYEKHGYREVDFVLPDGQLIQVRDGKDGFNIEENKKRLQLFRLCMSQADLVTTPSAVLSGVFKSLNKNVKVIKNFLDFRIWKPLNLIKDEWVRIGWQGGWSHYPDFAEIQPVLEEVMAKHPNTRLVIMGTDFPGLMKNLPRDRIDLEMWTGMETYPWKFKTLNIDIGLAPIVNNEFNTCKSEIKWEEYSSLGIPSCASDIPPYNLAIRDGKTGFLCSNTQEWVDRLSELISNIDLRRKMGQDALTYVREHYDIEKGVEQYRTAYNSLYSKELILA